MDEDDDRRWSQDMTQEHESKPYGDAGPSQLVLVKWMDGRMAGWLDGLKDTYFTPPIGRVGVIGVFCICFETE